VKNVKLMIFYIVSSFYNKERLISHLKRIALINHNELRFAALEVDPRVVARIKLILGQQLWFDKIIFQWYINKNKKTGELVSAG